MRTQSVQFPPPDAYEEQNIELAKNNTLLSNNQIFSDLSLKSLSLLMLGDNWNNCEAPGIGFSRQNSLQDLLSLELLPEDFRDSAKAGLLHNPLLTDLALEVQVGPVIKDVADPQPLRIETEPVDIQTTTVKEEKMADLTYTVMENAVADIQMGEIGVAFNGGVNEEGAEMVTVVLGDGGCWGTLTTVDGSRIGIPTNATVSTPQSLRTVLYSEDAVFATPATASSERNPFHFDKNCAARSSVSSGYSTLTSCATPSSAGSSCVDFDDASSAFSEATMEGDVDLAGISEDDELALQKLNITPLVKESLKNAIRKRRLESGLPHIDVDNGPKPKVKKEMTKEEESRYWKRREQNRHAATRFRNKQKSTADMLTRKCQNLEGSNNNLRSEIGRLLKETQELRVMLQSHLQHCPKNARIRR